MVVVPLCTKIYASTILNFMKESSGKKYTGIQAAVWIAAFLGLLIAFLIKQDDIMSVLKETAFFEHVFGKEPEFISRFEPPEKEKDTDTEQEEVIILGKNSGSVKKGGSPAEQTESKPDETAPPKTETKPAEPPPLPKAREETVSTPQAGAEDSVKPKEQKQSEKSVPETKPAPAAAKMNQYLCFIVINGDGIVERKEVNRAVPKTNTPLTAALTALLEGPGIPELEKGYISLIPQGTRLLSASVQNKTAFINFSQEFAFNKYGVDGYLGQLMQVVYTATAFGTIENVQFLIEGQKNEYLGGEGVWIGTPLARYNFK